MIIGKGNNMENAAIWAFLIWLAIGAFAGWLAGRMLGSRPFGLLGDIVIGMIGSFLGGWLFDLLGIFDNGLFFSFIVAFVGALIFLWFIRLLKKI